MISAMLGGCLRLWIGFLGCYGFLLEFVVLMAPG